MYYAKQRVELAAAFRWFHRLNMHEGIANHFTYVPDDEQVAAGKFNQFLVQPFGRDFSTIRASELLLVDFEDPSKWYRDVSNAGEKAKDMTEEELLADLPPIEPTAFCIHGEMHKLLGKRARCILHLHPHYCTALATLADKEIPAIDQNTARFYNRLSIDEDFGGMGLGEEARRLCTVMGPKNNCMILGNHGCVVIGETIGVCIDRMYYLEWAARTYMTALATGRPLKPLGSKEAETTAQQWDDLERHYAVATMREVLRVLDRECSDFRE
eukprot:TRINITY_DN14742_c0_g1_i1.p1 TRINITY_DN14742_c0_g1~~TRINITY_DN14742_c0_g1_i1.p1  ORF type:complete len:270 (-),score=61.17 TRINITY_DN14742_c0_g1_i1:276-1085(-)